MPLLDRNGSAEDRWTRSEGAAIGNIPAAIVPWEVLAAALDAQEPEQVIGVILPNSVPFSALEPFLPRLALVAIAFPAYSDGRGFSLARQIRRAGFAGEIRASGPLIADQFAYALSCGFDTIELPEASAARQPVPQWLRARDTFSATYQRGYSESGRNVLDQRRAARAAAPIAAE
ncbi:DUF934 domain-containing protein [Bosea robiniae]|uniref:Uncharacterized conserved protein, DUF934 family n=1 Tax=Bosea robiniae TaxID=1036780 RepID=A0ABY0P2W2_9HYPH|nr:DUF934 domain-containing protein [Bosea robiniae]SDG98551.1 Uncharacterized conserved protein, DUF934 family [Bosea robiniae]